MPKRPFIRKQKPKRHGVNFWDREYTNPEHLALSTEPSEDFLKFTRFLERHHPHLLAEDETALDLGCGNGRQLVFLLKKYGLQVIGYDTSRAAITQANALCEHSPKATLTVRSINEQIPLPDESCGLVLDMMTSHFLNATARTRLRQEIYRLLKPGGILMMKTFLWDEDLHSQRLCREHPGPEPYSYIHPVMGVPEYVYSEERLLEYLGEEFTIERIYRSHKHKYKGRARKRRTITVYAQKSF